MTDPLVRLGVWIRKSQRAKLAKEAKEANTTISDVVRGYLI